MDLTIDLGNMTVRWGFLNSILYLIKCIGGIKENYVGFAMKYLFYEWICFRAFFEKSILSVMDKLMNFQMFKEIVFHDLTDNRQKRD